MSKLQSAERVSQSDASDNYVYQRSLLAYHYAAQMLSGRVLEIGTGSGYGVSIIAPRVVSFSTIDKFQTPLDLSTHPNVEAILMKVPPLTGIESGSFDFVITFQVIEHIKNDTLFLEEIRRVLRPGGRLIISTPNKRTSLTRNPWHVREYTPEEFKHLLGQHFDSVDAQGVFGAQNVMEYYQANQRSVERITRYDIFGFQKWMPRWLLRIPYNILNRFNRRSLLDKNRALTSHIRMEDYSIAPVNDDCFDLIYICM